MVSFQIAKGFGYRFNIVSRGKGAHTCHFFSKKGQGWKILNTVWVLQGLFADIVVLIESHTSLADNI